MAKRPSDHGQELYVEKKRLWDLKWRLSWYPQCRTRRGQSLNNTWSNVHQKWRLKVKKSGKERYNSVYWLITASSTHSYKHTTSTTFCDPLQRNYDITKMESYPKRVTRREITSNDCRICHTFLLFSLSVIWPHSHTFSAIWNNFTLVHTSVSLTPAVSTNPPA